MFVRSEPLLYTAAAFRDVAPRYPAEDIYSETRIPLDSKSTFNHGKYLHFNVAGGSAPLRVERKCYSSHFG